MWMKFLIAKPQIHHVYLKIIIGIFFFHLFQGPLSPTNITFPKSFCSSHLFSFQTFSSRRWSVFTQSLSVNSALGAGQGAGQLPKIAIGNKKSAIFNCRLPKVNSQQFLLHQTPVEHCHCQARKETFFLQIPNPGLVFASDFIDPSNCNCWR